MDEKIEDKMEKVNLNKELDKKFIKEMKKQFRKNKKLLIKKTDSKWRFEKGNFIITFD